uniref:Putative lectin/glucanase superfamily protein n=1 Tax=viral metagenome TaxID=1070528 RepID=A0A6M3J682_9ZZZZ
MSIFIQRPRDRLLHIGSLGGLQYRSMGQGAVVLPCYYLSFDGFDDVINLAATTLSPPCTVSVWLKRASINTADGIIGATVGNRFWYLDSSATNVAYVRTGGGVSSSAGVWSSTDWVHGAIVLRNGASAIHYRNGVDVSGAPVTMTNLDNVSEIGRAAINNAYCFHGFLAVFGIAPAVLDVPALWAAGTFHQPLDPTVFSTACWNMRQEGGAGTALIDEAITPWNGAFKGAGEPAWGGLMSVGGPAGWSDT